MTPREDLLLSTCLLNLGKPFDETTMGSLYAEYGDALDIKQVTLTTSDAEATRKEIEAGTQYSEHGFQTLNFLVILPADYHQRRAALTALMALTGRKGVVGVVLTMDGLVVDALHSKYTRG